MKVKKHKISKKVNRLHEVKKDRNKQTKDKYNENGGNDPKR